MAAKLYTFNVTGDAFPLDMLRRDACWPVTSVDVDALADALAPYGKRKRAHTVRMASHKAPMVARWESFGWTVSDVALDGRRMAALRLSDGSVHMWGR